MFFSIEFNIITNGYITYLNNIFVCILHNKMNNFAQNGEIKLIDHFRNFPNPNYCNEYQQFSLIFQIIILLNVLIIQKVFFWILIVEMFLKMLIATQKM